MDTLKSVIAETEDRLSVMRRAKPDGRLAHLLQKFRKRVNKAIERFASLDVAKPEGVDWDVLVWQALKDPWQLTRKQKRSLPWALWREVQAPTWLKWLKKDRLVRIVDHGRKLRACLEVIVESNRQQQLRALVWEYMRNYRPGDKCLSAIGKSLVGWLSSGRQKWHDKWHARHEQWGLFGGGAHKRIARGFLDAATDEQDLADVAMELGLSSPIMRQSGMMEHAYMEGLRLYGKKPSMELLQSIMNWRDWTMHDGKALCDAEYANHLLSPWMTANPHENIKKQTMKGLLQSHGDPRIRQAQWIAVDHECKQVMYRWLTGESLKMFFDVITKIGGKGTHMWKARRDFWWAWHEAKYLSEAWVALGKQGELLIDSDVAYARLNNAQGNHAVLIMRIGNLIIADWNHSGRCRIWTDDNPSRPEPHKPSYRGPDLRSGSQRDFVHHGDWCPKVADCIKHYTGITI